MSYKFIYLANRIKLLDRLEQQIKLNIILSCGISMITHTIEIGQKLREKRSDSFGQLFLHSCMVNFHLGWRDDYSNRVEKKLNICYI